MGEHVFHNDDAGYFQWLDDHPGGYVINVAASMFFRYGNLHRSGCVHIRPRDGRAATAAYAKICSTDMADLERWAAAHKTSLHTGCGVCHRRPRTTIAPRAASKGRDPRAPLPAGRGLVEGPTAGRRIVRAWADDYLRYGSGRPAWQQDLRTELRAGIRQLRPQSGQLLHAAFAGAKPADADIENLLLYNVDAFRAAGANGIRFEQAAQVPPPRDGAAYPFFYRYELAAADAGFRDWRVVRDLASFDWIDLGALAGDRKVAQVWWALRRGERTVSEIPLGAATPFAVTVTIRPPLTETEPRPDLLMKQVFDGVVAAFQAHGDAAVLDDVAARLATIVLAEPAQIARYLSDTAGAVLGSVDQLVRPQRPAGTWNPGDHWCLAGELRVAPPLGGSWSIRGTVVEIARRTASSDSAGALSLP